jgi:tetratricopeptide (TPR) repeat protein
MTTGAKVLEREGVGEFRAGRYARAEKILARALRHDAGLADARLFRSSALRMLGRLPEARREIERAKDLRPTAAVLFASAVLAADLGRREEALVEIERASRLAPRSREILALRRRLARPKPYPSVAVDPRLELLSVVLSLAARRERIDGFEPVPESSYAKAAMRRFGRFESHRAVRLISKALRGGLTVIGAQRSLLRVSPPPELLEPEGERPRRPEILQALNEFAVETGFMRFFEEQAGFYRRCVAGVEKQMRGRDYAAILESYTGRRVTAPYTLALCPMRAVGSAGNLNFLERGDAGPRVVSAVGPSRLAAGAPRFDYAALRWDIWHELAHTLLDDLFEEKGDGPWEHSVLEHMAQGLASRLVRWADATGRAKGPACGRRGEGLIRLDAVQERLAIFEKERRRYPTIDAFYPKLKAAVSSLPRSGGRRSGRDDGIL